MRIGDVLHNKDRTVHSILPWCTVADAVDRLYRNRIGALVVCDEERRLRGIISERDIVRALRTHGTALLTMRVDEIMTHYVVTAAPDEPIDVAMARMTAGRHRHLPVVSDGHLLGVVSMGDLVKHRVQEVELERGVLRDAYIAAH